MTALLSRPVQNFVAAWLQSYSRSKFQYHFNDQKINGTVSGHHLMKGLWAYHAYFQKKIVFTWEIMIRSSHNFAQVTIAQLSWHVHNCDLIWSSVFTRFHSWDRKTLWNMSQNMAFIVSADISKIGSTGQTEMHFFFKYSFAISDSKWYFFNK